MTARRIYALTCNRHCDCISRVCFVTPASTTPFHTNVVVVVGYISITLTDEESGDFLSGFVGFPAGVGHGLGRQGHDDRMICHVNAKRPLLFLFV